jgi:hypothetical protein
MTLMGPVFVLAVGALLASCGEPTQPVALDVVFRVDSQGVLYQNALASPRLTSPSPGRLELSAWLRTPCLAYDATARAERLGTAITIAVAGERHRRSCST